MNVKEAVQDLKEMETIKETDQAAQCVERIYVSSESLARILDNISAMVNLSAGLTPVNRAQHDLKELINICSSRMQKNMPTYQWKLLLDNTLASIPFDYDLMELLFYNLAFHAMEFSPPDSTIEIETKQMGDYVLMSIAGQGQSIPSEMVDVAFEKFYRVPGSSSHGLGLGLAIAKAIVEIHNGTLQVKNRPEGGMIFSLFLPLA